MQWRTIVRYGAYPLVFGGAAAAVFAAADATHTAGLRFALIAAGGVLAVALLERLQPFQPAWNQDHGDTWTDALHLLVNLGLLSAAAGLLHALAGALPATAPWPRHWPVGVQIIAAGAVVDLGLYAMHRLSHRIAWLWRLHAIHHSAERLYWMNGERRHPLSAVLLAGPGLAATALLGAPPAVVSAWLTLLTVHLAFQHANLDYSLGPLRGILGVAESHRWHHKREYEDAEVNFGEFWLLWDRLFGTYRDPRTPLAANAVGLREAGFPATYAAQWRWPFARRTGRPPPA